MSNQATKAMAHALQWKITGDTAVSEACTEGKAN
jgi:hypothetical protein